MPDSINSESRENLNCRSFHYNYLKLCRAKNVKPLRDIKRAKNNGLNLFGDRLTFDDWILIEKSLYHDQVLQTLIIRMRKPFGMVLEDFDTEKKAKSLRQEPVIHTKFIFSGVVEAISNCIEFNKDLRVLNLEGLPLNGLYVEAIARALSSNNSIKEISFQNSKIQDKGCAAICNTIKYLENIEKLNLSNCDLTSKGSEYVADMIKVQKIRCYTESWQKSLRYRLLDPETIPGLRSITLSRNPKIGDEGLKQIIEVLKEDEWIKVIELENCGLTDFAANMILDCSKLYNSTVEFNVRANAGINKLLKRRLRDQFEKDVEDRKSVEEQEDLLQGPNSIATKGKKPTTAALKVQVKNLEDQLAFERILRKKGEQLIDNLNQQIAALENQLQSVIRERNEFEKLAAKIKHNQDITPCNYVVNGQAITRRSLRVRKAKSELKCVDSPIKNSNKKTESKSDHEFLNENDIQLTAVHFETNIGDSITNQARSSRSENSSVTLTNFKTDKAKDKKLNNINMLNKRNSLETFEIDDLIIPSTPSFNSDINSSDSDTLRNFNMETQQLKVNIRREKPFPLTPMPKTFDRKMDEDAGNNLSHNGGYDAVAKSARSLFLGRCDNGGGDISHNGDNTSNVVKSPRSIFFGLCGN